MYVTLLRNDRYFVLLYRFIRVLLVIAYSATYEPVLFYNRGRLSKWLSFLASLFLAGVHPLPPIAIPVVQRLGVAQRPRASAARAVRRARQVHAPREARFQRGSVVAACVGGRRRGHAALGVFSRVQLRATGERASLSTFMRFCLLSHVTPLISSFC